MALSLLPVPPQRSDPANFAARGDAFMAALPTFVSEFNAQVPNVVAGDQGITGNLVVNGNSTLGNATNDVITIGVNGIIKNAAGNVGFGITPSAWGSNVRALQLTTTAGSTTAISAILSTDELVISRNCYYDGTTWRYIANSNITQYQQSSAGEHVWSSSGFGTPGAAVTPTVRLRIDLSGNISTGTDNAQTLGTAANRWSVVYAGTGTINTSDARDKTEVQAFTANEIKAAVLLSKSFGTYQWLEQVKLKGSDARKHIGTTVQHAIEIMQSCNLDPFEYGFICHDAWEATETDPAGDRYGFRYDELNTFIAAGISARLTALEQAAGIP